MSSDGSRRHIPTQQGTLHVRVLRKEPQLQLPKEPQLQNPRGIGKTVVLMHLRDQEDTGVDYSPRTLTCLTPQFG